MKSCFIENTNKQYSIREDGRIIRNYKITSNQDKKFCKLIYKESKKHTVRLYDNTVRSLSIAQLLNVYFGFIICTKCKNKTYNKKDLSKIHFRMCVNCAKKNIVLKTYKWKKENPLLSKKHAIAQHRKHCDNLTNNYISSKLNISIKIITDDIIDAKKQQLLLHRQLKTIKNENRIKSNHNNTIRYDERS